MALGKSVKGINIPIGGDIAGLGKALSSAEGQISSLSTELRAINKELNFDPTNTTLLTQRTEALADQMGAVSEKLKVLKSNQEQVNSGFDAMGNAISKADVRAYNREVETTENILKTLEASQGKANRELAAGKAEFTNIGKAVKETSAELTDTNKTVKKMSEEFKSAKDSASVFEQAFKGADDTLTNFEKEIKSLNPQIKSVSKSSEEAGSNIEEFGNDLDDAGEKSSMFADVLKANLTSEAIIGAVKAIGNAVKDIGISLVETAATVRAETSQFNQAFGDLGGEAQAAIERVADASGILDTRLRSTGTAIYAFARSNGAETSQAMGLMEKALQAAADGAAYYGRSLENVSDSLMSFLKGNYTNDAALGVSATEFTRNAKAAELFGKKFQDLSEIQKQETLLQMVLDAQELSGAMGQAAREADGLENVKGNLGEIKRQLIAILGEPILDGITPVIQKITETLKDARPQIEQIAQGIGETFSFLLNNGPVIIATIGGIAAGITLMGNAAKAAALAQALTSMLNPISLISLAVGGAVIGFTSFNKAMEESREKALRTGESLQGLVEKIESTRKESTNFNNLVNEFEDLKKSIESNTLTAEELEAAQAKLTAKGEQLISTSGGLVSAYEIENGISEAKIKLLREEYELKEKMAVQNAKEYLASNSYDELQFAVNRAKKEVEDLVAQQSKQEAAVIRLKELQAEYNSRLNDSSRDIRTYETEAERMMDLQMEYSTKMREHADVLGITVDYYDEIGGVVQRGVDSWTATGRAVDEANKSLITGEKNLLIYQENQDIVNGKVSQGKKESEDYAKTLIKQSDALDKATQAVIQQRHESDSLITSISKTDEALHGLDAAYQKTQEGIKLTEKEIAELSKAFPELSQYIEQNGIESVNNGEILKALGEQTREERKKNIDAAIAEQEAAISAMRNQAEQSALSYKAIITNISSVAAARQALAKTETMGPNLPDNMKLKREIEESEKTLDRLKQLSESITSGETLSSGKKSTSGGGKSVADEAEKQRKEALAADMAAYNHRLKMGELSKDAQIEQLEEIRDKHKLTLDEEWKFEEDIYSLKNDIAKKEADDKKKFIDEATKLMKDQYQADLKEAEKSYKNKTKLFKDVQYTEKSVIESTKATQKNAYKDELYNFEGVTDAKIKLIDDAYIAQVEASDKATAQTLRNINAETEALLEKLKITNAPLYNEIMAGREEKQKIQDELEARKRALQEQRNEERKAELQKRIDEAETLEQREGYLKELADFEAELTYTQWQESENAKIKQLEAREKELVNQINENNKKTAEEAELLRKDSLEKNIKQLEDDFSTLETKYNELIENAMSEAEKIAEDEAYKMGGMTVDGITEAIKDKGPEAVKAMKTLAQQIVDAYNETMDINSPSRVMRRQTHFVGDGVIVGIKDMLSSIKAAATAIPDSIATVMGNIPQALDMYKFGQNAGSDFSTGMEDAIGIIERAAANLGISAVPKVSMATAGSIGSTSAGVSGLNVSFNIGNFVNNTDRDIERLGHMAAEQIAEQLAFMEKQKLTGRGKKY